MYSCLNDRSTNRIGWENILKADHSKWINQQKIEFIDFDQLKTKNKKLNISNVFKISIQKNLKPNWTEKQVKWIESGINLKKIFTSNLKTIARIDDFRRKFFSTIGIRPECLALFVTQRNSAHLTYLTTVKQLNTGKSSYTNPTKEKQESNPKKIATAKIIHSVGSTIGVYDCWDMFETNIENRNLKDDKIM
jgi:hypothetical protein